MFPRARSRSAGLRGPRHHGHPPTPTPHRPHLHHCVVDGDEVGEQVQVPGGEDESKKDLALPRDACGQTRRGENETRTPRPHDTQEAQCPGSPPGRGGGGLRPVSVQLLSSAQVSISGIPVSLRVPARISALERVCVVVGVGGVRASLRSTLTLPLSPQSSAF